MVNQTIRHTTHRTLMNKAILHSENLSSPLPDNNTFKQSHTPSHRTPTIKTQNHITTKKREIEEGMMLLTRESIATISAKIALNLSITRVPKTILPNSFTTALRTLDNVFNSHRQLLQIRTTAARRKSPKKRGIAGDGADVIASNR